FSAADASNLSLIDTTAMDESVLTGNIARGVENLCYEELQTLNRAMGHLLGDPELSTKGNPLAPTMIVEAFAQALNTVKAGERVKFAILKELNQTALFQINDIYADINQHLVSLHVVPTGRARIVNRAGIGARLPGAGASGLREPMPTAPTAAAAGGEVDIMALFKRMFGAPGAGAM